MNLNWHKVSLSFVNLLGEVSESVKRDSSIDNHSDDEEQKEDP